MAGWLLTSWTLDGRLAAHKLDIRWEAGCSQAGLWMGGWLLTSRTLDGRLAVHKLDIRWEAGCSQAGH